MNIPMNFKGIVLAIILLVAGLHNTEAQKKQPAELVYPLLDAANSRWFFFSSACRPFGMVNLSPDTKTSGAWGSGYLYNTDTIRGFSHIHAWQLSGLSVMPVVFTEENKRDIFNEYCSKFSHEKEKVAPGYHYVELEKYEIVAELTSTKRVGFHRYTFPEKAQAAIVFNVNGELGPSNIVDGTLKQTGEKQLQGQLVNAPTIRRPKPASVFFSVEFNTKIKSVQKDETSGNYLVELENVTPVLMKAAISYTSIENAAKNMATELSGWDFDKMVSESQEEWNSLLSRIVVEGGTKKDQRRFYTDLWHALQGRRIISDVNGAYPDNTGETFRIGQIPLDKNGKPQFNHYNSDSFWGAQWTLNTLWQLVYPEIAEDFIHSFMQYYKDGGLIPRGPSGGNYTYVMTGASSTPFIVSAYMKGIRGFDVEKAYEGMRKNAMPGGIMSKAGYEHESNVGGGLKYYIENGYVPYPNPNRNDGYHNQGAGQTLEYAYQDWCLAQMALALGKDDDYKLFMKRAGNYKNVWDEETGWMRPRQLNESWIEPFNPIQSHHGFVESTAAQSTWFVPHDLNGLFNLMGGAEKAAKKLNQQFLIADVHDFVSRSYKADKFVNSQRKNTFLNYGNQPSMQVGFVFNYAGQPWLTQFWTREVISRIYSDLDPQNGFNGDEDQGLMGALSVLMKMGIFQMKGGADINSTYEIGSPLFDKVTINLNPDYYMGKQFIIETKNNSDKNRYVQAINLNGEVLNKIWFNHNDIVYGGKLFLEMGSKPNKEFGNEP